MWVVVPHRAAPPAARSTTLPLHHRPKALVWPKESAISRCRWNGAGFSFTDDAARTIEMHIQIAKRWDRKRLGGFKWGGVRLQHGEKIKNIC